MKPTITIITACKNALEDLRHTVESVNSQSYEHKEHIIIDGASADGTMAWLSTQKLPHLISQSEPDEGISDAFNKGVRRAKGEYVFFLGAGDTFQSTKVLAEVFDQLDERPLLICGKIMRVSQRGETLWQAPKRWPRHFHKKALLKKLALPHQGLFMHRDYFKQYGLFDKHCKFAMDYELILRSYHNFPEIKLLDTVVASWQAGGIGENRTLEIYDEYHRIKLLHEVAPPWRLKWIDFWNRLKLKAKHLIALT